MLENERGDLTRAVIRVLENNKGRTLLSYEVFERMAYIGVVVDAKQVRDCLQRLARRKTIKKQVVSGVRDRYKVFNRYSVW